MSPLGSHHLQISHQLITTRTPIFSRIPIISKPLTSGILTSSCPKVKTAPPHLQTAIHLASGSPQVSPSPAECLPPGTRRSHIISNSPSPPEPHHLRTRTHNTGISHDLNDAQNPGDLPAPLGILHYFQEPVPLEWPSQLRMLIAGPHIIPGPSNRFWIT